MRVVVIQLIFAAVLLTIQPAAGQNAIIDLYAEAVSAHDSGDFERAIELYSAVIDRDSTHANAYWNRANLWPDEMNARALLDYKKVSELAPSFDAGHGNYGFSLLVEKDLANARKASFIAHELDKNIYSWPLNIGHTYFLEGNADSAKTFYKWALFRMESREDLNSALSDFDIFVEKGWDPEGSSAMRRWMQKSYDGKD